MSFRQFTGACVAFLSFQVLPVCGGVFTESEVRFEQQVSTDGGLASLTDGEGPIPDNLDRTYTTDNAIYNLDAVSLTLDPFALKSSAKVEVNIDARGTDLGWNNVSASSRAVAGLIATACIQGVPGQVGGYVEFLWAVTGSSAISLDPVLSGDAYVINELSSIAIFNPSEGDGTALEVFIDEQGGIGAGPSVDSAVPAVFGPQTFVVDWFAGEEFDVYFELATVARLDVGHVDAAGFNASVDADFSNTAILQQIQIFNNDGELLPNAIMRSADPSGNGPVYMNVVSVPEPSVALVGLLLATVLSGQRFWQRCRQRI